MNKSKAEEYVIKVISDAHMSPEGKENDFKINDLKFSKYIYNMIATSDQAVLNGDIFETLQGEKWGDFESRFHEIVRDYPMTIGAICSGIVSKSLVLIAGNHDFVVRLRNLLQTSVEIPRRYVLTGSFTVVFEHGNVPDFFNYKYEWAGRFISWAVGWIERLIWTDIDVKAARLVGKLKKVDEMKRRPYEKYAERLAKQEDADIVVLGHTHEKYYKRYMPTESPTGKGLHYIDCGKSCDRENAIEETKIVLKKRGCTISTGIISL